MSSNYGLVYARLVGTNEPAPGTFNALLDWNHKSMSWQIEYVNLSDQTFRFTEDSNLDDENTLLLSMGGSSFGGNFFTSHRFKVEVNTPSVLIIPAGGVSDPLTITLTYEGGNSTSESSSWLTSTGTIRLPFYQATVTATYAWQETFNSGIFIVEQGPHQDGFGPLLTRPYETVSVVKDQWYVDVLTVRNTSEELDRFIDVSDLPQSNEFFDVEYFTYDWENNPDIEWDNDINWQVFGDNNLFYRWLPINFNVEDPGFMLGVSTPEDQAFELVKFRIRFKERVRDYLLRFELRYTSGFGIYTNRFTCSKKFTTSGNPSIIASHTGKWIVPKKLEEFSLFAYQSDLGIHRRYYCMYKPTLNFYNVGSALDWDYIQDARWHGEVTFSSKAEKVLLNFSSHRMGNNDAYYKDNVAYNPNNPASNYTRTWSFQGPWLLHQGRNSFDRVTEYVVAVYNQTKDEWRLKSVFSSSNVSIDRSLWTDEDDFSSGEKLIYQVVRFSGNVWSGENPRYLNAAGTALSPRISGEAFDTSLPWNYWYHQGNLFISPPEENTKKKYTVMTATVPDGPRYVENQGVINELDLRKPVIGTADQERQIEPVTFGDYFADVTLTSTGASPALYSVSVAGTNPELGPETLDPPIPLAIANIGASRDIRYKWTYTTKPQTDLFLTSAIGVDYRGWRSQFGEIPYVQTRKVLTQNTVDATGLANYTIPFGYDTHELRSSETEQRYLTFYVNLANIRRKITIKGGWKIGSI